MTGTDGSTAWTFCGDAEAGEDRPVCERCGRIVDFDVPPAVGAAPPASDGSATCRACEVEANLPDDESADDYTRIARAAPVPTTTQEVEAIWTNRHDPDFLSMYASQIVAYVILAGSDPLGAAAEPPSGGVVSVSVPRERARALARLAGLGVDERGRYGGEYWQLDEALTVAVERLAAREGELTRALAAARSRIVDDADGDADVALLYDLYRAASGEDVPFPECD